MRSKPVITEDFRGVFPVPPLCRKSDGSEALDFSESGRVVRHIAAGGIRNFLYGGNAFLYHITLAEYEEVLDWCATWPDDHWMIPSAGPSFGRAMDQAPLLRRHPFPTVMVLPCGDPRDAAGLEAGYRRFSDAAGMRLIVYLKDEGTFGADRDAGLDAVARLVRDGVCVGIKYAVVRKDPRVDAYLSGLIARVGTEYVISGIGERPAIVHMRDFGLRGFTTGSGCIAPALSRALFEANTAGQWNEAQKIREPFIPLEDFRDGWGPARVLHAATELASIAQSGPISPYITPIDEAQRLALAPVSKELAALNASYLATGALDEAMVHTAR